MIREPIELNEADLQVWAKSLLEELVFKAALISPDSEKAQMGCATEMIFKLSATQKSLHIYCDRIDSEPLEFSLLLGDNTLEDLKL